MLAVELRGERVARPWFEAAALAVGASGGADLTPLTSLCRAGVAAPGGHGGFAAIERDVASKLANGKAFRSLPFHLSGDTSGGTRDKPA